MKSKLFWFGRLIVWFLITYILIDTSGLAGFIDALQFVEVFLTSIIFGILLRCINKRGLSEGMEYTSLIAGILWTLINLFVMWRRYHTLEQVMILISTLSIWYGLLFSIGSSLLLRIHNKNKEQRRDFYE